MIQPRRNHPEQVARPPRTAADVELTDPVVEALAAEAEAGYNPAVLHPRPQSVPVEAFTARWHAVEEDDGSWVVTNRRRPGGGVDPDGLILLRTDMATIAVYVAYLHNHLWPDPDTGIRPAAAAGPVAPPAEEAA